MYTSTFLLFSTWISIQMLNSHDWYMFVFFSSILQLYCYKDEVHVIDPTNNCERRRQIKSFSYRVSKNYKIHHQKNLSPTMTLTFDLWHWHKCSKFAWDSSKVVTFWVYSSYIWTPACTYISQGIFLFPYIPSQLCWQSDNNNVISFNKHSC